MSHQYESRAISTTGCSYHMPESAPGPLRCNRTPPTWVLPSPPQQASSNPFAPLDRIFSSWWAPEHGVDIYTTHPRYPARDLWERAGKAWEEMRSLESIQGQHGTLVVAHNAINQALLWTALGCDTSYFRKISWPNCAVLELQWRRGEPRAERYRWVIPEVSPFVEASDAARLLKESEDDTQFTL